MSSETTRKYERRVTGPRRVSGGIKLERAAPDWSRRSIPGRWLELFTAGVDPEVMAEGLRYAQTGQTIRLETEPGALAATVQGTLPRPYEVRLRLPVLAEAQWTDVIDAMALEAIYVARLLADELPASITDLFRERQVELLPAGLDDLEITCTCGARTVCKHASAAAYLFAELLERRPATLLALRGMEPQLVLDRLLQTRAGTSAGPAAHFDPMIPESRMPASPLEACLEEYWRPADGTAGASAMPRSDVAHALLRRMGPSPLGGKFPMVGLLASIYEAVSTATDGIEDRVANPESGNGEVDATGSRDDE